MTTNISRMHFIEVCDAIISHLEGDDDPADVDKYLVRQLNACLRELSIAGEPIRVERDWGNSDTLWLDSPPGSERGSVGRLATYNESGRIPQNVARNRSEMLFIIGQWVRFVKYSPEAYDRSDLAKLSKLQRSAVTKYIELAGLPKTKRGQRGRTFSPEDTKAFLFAVKRNCRTNKHREAAAKSLGRLGVRCH